MNESQITMVSALLTPILFGIVTFFLRSLISRFNHLEEEVKTFMIRNASFEQRVITLEEKLRIIDKLVFELATKKR